MEKTDNRIRVKNRGIYKLRQEMSKREGRYLTINEALHIIQENIKPTIL